MKLSIVIPVYNEEKSIDEVVGKILSVPIVPDWDKEVIIVDDGSTDGTRERLSKYNDKAKVVFHEKNLGKGGALKTGFRAATGDYIIIQDADLEYDCMDYNMLLVPITSGEAETVFGSRVLGRNNVAFSHVYYYGGLMVTGVFNLCFRTKLSDLATCYKIFPARFVDDLIVYPHNDFVFDVVNLSHFLVGRTKVAEVPISYVARPKSEGKKMNWRHGYKCLREIVRLYFTHGKISRKH